MVFQAIAERPQLDRLTREERIREKLKFFNLEHEDLQTSKERIREKVNRMTTRFGPISSNLIPGKQTSNMRDGGVDADMYNPFKDMMSIEAEFGCIFTTEEEKQLEIGRTNSKWFPLLEAMTRKKKHKNFVAIIESAQKRKEQKNKQRQLEIIRDQLARGVKVVDTTAFTKGDSDDEEGLGEKIDVQKILAEIQRKQQHERMEQMVNSINDLCQKSIDENNNLTEIKDYINYKYPSCPSNDSQGRDIYDKCFYKIVSRWQYNELEEMKDRSVIKRRADSRQRKSCLKKNDMVDDVGVSRLDSCTPTKDR